MKNLSLDAGLFAFYDEQSNFRLSLVYKTYEGTKEEFSHYKRHTFTVLLNKPHRTFEKQLSEGNFSTLEGIIRSFSIEPLTKEFYEEVRNWYAYALRDQRVRFPGGKKEENLIRLITRLMFVWFFKEKGLVPEEIFEEDFLKGVVKDFRKGSNYYNAVLQNLFFATLNRPIKERAFAEEGHFVKEKKHYMVKNLYRYKDLLLISEQEFIKLFERTPFINGGLFECLDSEEEYIDGFSRNPDKRAVIPDKFFFGEGIKADLSEFYGKKKKVEIRGLIKILSSYSWTVEESTPIDIEVSLDPELLGLVFENLLAEYNEETQDTARKATGSYYTPKEVVDFMVEESLMEYFKGLGFEEEKVRKLLSYTEDSLELSEEERKKILQAIDRIKVIDPAVGSGAFPMGMLHKLVHMLEKLDPNNELWKEYQLRKAQEVFEKLYENKEENRRLLKEVEEDFNLARFYPDYARKLYVLRDSIFGVDIQNIAVQLCKLRFFLSLIIDQKTNPQEENLGIKPLPYLEGNFVCANSLTGRDGAGKQLNMLNQSIKPELEELLILHRKHFTVRSYTEKKRLEEKEKEIRQRILKKLAKNHSFDMHTAQRIAELDLFKQTKCYSWFNPVWFFGFSEGFDIVISNPPYVRQERIKEQKEVFKKEGYEVFSGTADLYVYFYERGLELLKEGGVLCYISSNKWLRAKYGEKLREYLKKETTLLKLIDFKGYRVFAQTVDTCIVLLKKEKPSKDHLFEYIDGVPEDLPDHRQAIEYIRQNLRKMPHAKLSTQAFVLGDDRLFALKEKIERVGKPLKEWDVKIYRGVLTGYNEAFIIDTETRDRILANCRTEEERRRTEEIIKPVLRGRDIGRYCYEWKGLWLIGTFPALNLNIDDYPALKSYLKSFGDRLLQDGKPGHRKKTNNKWFETQDSIAYYPEFEKEKVVWREMTYEPSFAFDEKGFFTNQKAYIMTGKNLKYLLAILNSKVSFWYMRNLAYSLSEGAQEWIKQYVELIPIPPITPQNQHIVQQIEELVDKVIQIKKEKGCHADTSELERQIDQLVYRLYGLTEEEIKLVEEESTLFKY